MLHVQLYVQIVSFTIAPCRLIRKTQARAQTLIIYWAEIRQLIPSWSGEFSVRIGRWNPIMLTTSCDMTGLDRSTPQSPGRNYLSQAGIRHILTMWPPAPSRPLLPLLLCTRCEVRFEPGDAKSSWTPTDPDITVGALSSYRNLKAALYSSPKLAELFSGKIKKS